LQNSQSDIVDVAVGETATNPHTIIHAGFTTGGHSVAALAAPFYNTLD
jgi:hypothetical protein